MPNLDNISPVEYQATDVYHVDKDNLPLRNINQRIELLNNAVEVNNRTVREAQGSAGTLSNRLNQSLEEGGSLKTAAVDESLHNIGAHEDGEYDGVEYVRMKSSERDKLELVSDEATALVLQFQTISTTISFDDDTVTVIPSDSINWTLTAPNQIKAETVFPVTAVRNHYYDLTPVHDNVTNPDYQNYKTTSLSTPFIEDTLRVYVNGIRLSATDSVYVPPASGPSGSWKLTTYTPDHTTGTFVFSRILSSNDIIRIDFDTSYA